MIRALATLTSAALLSACAVGPDYRQPPEPAVERAFALVEIARGEHLLPLDPGRLVRRGEPREEHAVEQTAA